MTVNERSNFINEDYADFIIDYRTIPNVENLIPDSIVQYINETYAVIHVPLSQISGRNIQRLRVVTIPHLFGLTSEVSLEASGVTSLRNVPAFQLRGGGVLIGIVDTGINYTLPAFRKQDGTSKVYSIWDQTLQSENASPFQTNYGTEYKAEQINQAIGSADPFTVVPTTDENGHGTMLAGITAGTENPQQDFAGVAPDAELIVVKLLGAKRYLREQFSIPDGVICYQEDDIMWGVQYCIETARRANRPIVICLGVGTSQGAHDGTTPLSLQTGAYADIPHIGVVVAAGNEGNLGRHFHATIDPAVGNIPVELEVGENGSGFSMELWGNAPGIYSIDIMSPSGEYIPRITASIQVSRQISFIFEETTIDLEYQTVESLSGDQLIRLIFKKASIGIWKFTVFLQGNLPGEINIWLPMGEFLSRETHFVQPDIDTTIVVSGNSLVPLTVTAYNPVNGALYANASRGYTRANAIKPELAAPGVNYIAPDLNGGYTGYTGTGVAAAHMAGIVALAMEWGVVKGNAPGFDTQEIKKYLIRGAKRTSNLTYPNQDWGYGIVDLYNTFNVLRANV